MLGIDQNQHDRAIDSGARVILAHLDLIAQLLRSLKTTSKAQFSVIAAPSKLPALRGGPATKRPQVGSGNAASTLMLDSSVGIAGTVTGFAANGHIDLGDILASSAVLVIRNSSRRKALSGFRCQIVSASQRDDSASPA